MFRANLVVPVQICSELYLADKVKFMDRQTDGRADTGNDDTHSAFGGKTIHFVAKYHDGQSEADGCCPSTMAHRDSISK